MVQAEMVTNCALSHAGQQIHLSELMNELNAYLRSTGHEPEESEFRVSPLTSGNPSIPMKYRWLVAFAVEGSNEGYYIHVGAIEDSIEGMAYVLLGIAKTCTPTNAYAVAREAARFLTAAQWN